MAGKTKSFEDVDRALAELEGKIPKHALQSGHQLDDIDLTTSTLAVPHKLGRRPLGYLVVGANSGATLWEEEPRNTVNLYLQASANVTVSLWVY